MLMEDNGTGVTAGELAGTAGGAAAGTILFGGPVGLIAGGVLLIYSFFNDAGDIEFPNIQYTPYAIFTNKIGMLNADFFNSSEEEKNGVDSVEILKPVVSKWYSTLKSVAIVGLLTVLVYIGIRIIISSASQEKAKYKQLLKDWLVAMCLLFVLHYIMSFTMMATRYITKAFSEGEAVENIELQVPKDFECIENDSTKKDEKAFEKHYDRDKGVWKVNIVEAIRLNITFLEDANSQKLGYTIMYIVLCIITCVFTFQYVKRVIYLAILTLIAPIIALTYPIDKIADGQAQGFNMWLKEYIFNALLQVMHLILYSIVITSAVELVKNNIIYGIVALGCMTMAETMLRKIFGFEKASTVGAFGGAAGAALVMSGLGKIKGPKGAKKGGNSSSSDKPKIWNNNKRLDSEGILRDSFNNNDKQTKEDSKTDEKKSNEDSKANNGNVPDKQSDNRKTKVETNTNIMKNNNNKGTANNNTKQTNKKSKANKTKKIKKPRSGAASYALRQYGRRHNLGFKSVSGKIGKGIGRGIVKGAGAAMGATVGLAAGVASGDMSKAVQYAAGGAYAGGKLSGKIGHSIASEVSSVHSDYKQGLANIDSDYAAEKRYKEFKKESANKQYIETRYTDSAERDEVYNVAKEATKYGFTDVEEISAIHELMGQGKSLKEACAIGKMSKKMGDISQPKARKDWVEHLTSKGFSKEQAELIINNVDKFNGYKG